MVEYLVVGAGPAGLQMGRFLHGAGRDYLIVEAGPEPAGFFRRFPRHRVLSTDDNSLFDGAPFTRYSKRSFPATARRSTTWAGTGRGTSSSPPARNPTCPRSPASSTPRRTRPPAPIRRRTRDGAC
jgi:2-polyprenyl-6-methoxyphenol hydroxylase-like FAD-dependent oxidoreductase